MRAGGNREFSGWIDVLTCCLKNSRRERAALLFIPADPLSFDTVPIVCLSPPPVFHCHFNHNAAAESPWLCHGLIESSHQKQNPPTSNNSVNIHIITDTYAPEINGVAMTLERLVKGLTSRGHSLTVIRPRQRHESPQYSVTQRVACKQVRLPGVPVPGYPQLRIGLPAFKSLRSLWSDSSPDIVHIATEGPLGASAVRVAVNLRIPVTSSFHTNFHEYAKDYRMQWLKPLVNRWLRYFHNSTACTFAPTQDLIHRLNTAGYNNLRRLSRGVDSSLFSPQRRDESIRRSWGVGERDLAVIHVGRIAAEKNYPLVFETFDRIKHTHPSARLVLVGDGPLLSEYQRRRPDAIFSGFYSGKTLAAHYASGDLYLHASLTETFGNVVTEAMASGLAVSAFDDAAAHEFIRSGDNGLTATIGDSESFIANALKLASDRELRHRLGAAARATALELDWGNVIDGFEKDLTQISEAYPPKRKTNRYVST